MRKSRDHAHDNLAVVGLTDFLRQLLFASSFPAFFAEPLIASPIRSMAELAALGAPFELSHYDSRMVGNPEVIRFIRHEGRGRRFFRASLAASNFRSRSA